MFKQLHKKYSYPTNNSNVQPNIQQNENCYEGTFNKATTTSTQPRLKSNFQNLELYKWTDKDGKNILHIAVIKGDFNFTKNLLLSNRLDINSTDQFNMSALHYAIIKGHTEITKLLLEYNINLNIVCCFGKTPLHYAVENKFESIQEILINSGAILDNKFFETKKEEIKTFKDQIHHLDRKIENIKNGLYLLDEKLKASKYSQNISPKESQSESLASSSLVTNPSKRKENPSIQDIFEEYKYHKYTQLDASLFTNFVQKVTNEKQNKNNQHNR
ncbi:Ankyrin repeat protein [Rickettsiales bacterium Ac37b]|nr:Ankyrin repeat protein [Rickettsiales bacterium Ac37b]